MPNVAIRHAERQGATVPVVATEVTDDMEVLDRWLNTPENDNAVMLRELLEPKLIALDVVSFMVRQFDDQPLEVFVLINDQRQFLIGTQHGDPIHSVREPQWLTAKLEAEWVNGFVSVITALLEQYQPRKRAAWIRDVWDWKKQQLLQELAANTAEQKRLKDRADELVAEAREVEATWQEIGDAIGIKPQTAYQRWNATGKLKHAERQRQRTQRSKE